MNQNSSLKEKPILVSIIPNLMEGEGHIIPYHIAVSKAANLLEWKHIAAIRPDASIKNLPHNWHNYLSSANLEEKIHPLIRILRLYDVWSLSISIVGFLNREVLPYTNYPIIFLERFIHLQLLALLISLYIISKKNHQEITVWLLYRKDTHKDKTCWIYKLLNNLIKQKITANKFHLLTDSEVLSKSLGNYFKEVFTVMPIPHTNIIKIENTSLSRDKIICWWPGNPRPEKGWQIIKSIVNTNCNIADKICLVAAQNSQLLAVKNGVKLNLIANYLTEEEYLNWLKSSDIILLPYDSSAYRERTSGIFTECIFAGKIPLVTEGTWMAQELREYELSELIIEWSEPESIIKQIMDMAKSEILKIKINKMQAAYQSFHSIETYAKYMNKLFQKQ